MNHVAKIPSETYENLSYMTRIGKEASCTCPSHLHRGGICKHQKTLEVAVGKIRASGITHLVGAAQSMGIVPSETGRGTYLTSLGPGGSCTCLAKYHNPRKMCKHQKSLKVGTKAIAKTGIVHLGSA